MALSIFPHAFPNWISFTLFLFWRSFLNPLSFLNCVWLQHLFFPTPYQAAFPPPLTPASPAMTQEAKDLSPPSPYLSRNRLATNSSQAQGLLGHHKRLMLSWGLVRGERGPEAEVRRLVFLPWLCFTPSWGVALDCPRSSGGQNLMACNSQRTYPSSTQFKGCCLTKWCYFRMILAKLLSHCSQTRRGGYRNPRIFPISEVLAVFLLLFLEICILAKASNPYWSLETF